MFFLMSIFSEGLSSFPSWWHGVFNPDWLTAIGTIGATVVALALAAQSWIRSFFTHPELQIEVSQFPPYSDRTTWINGAAVHYYRLSVENKSGTIAQDVHVFVDSVDKLDEDGRAVPAPRFRPMFLKWAHLSAITMPALWKDIPRFCDLLHITDPDRKHDCGETLSSVPRGRGVMCLDLEAKANSLGHLLEPGVYRITLRVAATNCSPCKVVIQVNYPVGVWHRDEDQMQKHISIEKL
ncbi:MAG TPA: hypothetical protein VGG46_11050 [Terriglobales bacterium]